MGGGTPKALHCSSIVSPALAITGSDELTNRSSTGSRSCTEIEVLILLYFSRKTHFYQLLYSVLDLMTKYLDECAKIVRQIRK